MVFSTIICSIFLLLAIIATHYVYKGIFLNPAVIFLGVWWLNFFAYELDRFFGFYYVGLGQKTQLLFLLSFFGFFLGSLSVAFWENSKKETIQQVDEKQYIAFLEKITYLFFGLVIVGLFGKIVILVKNFGNFFNHLEEIRALVVSRSFHYPAFLEICNVFRYALILNLAVLIGFANNKRRYIVFTIIAFLLSIGTDLTVAGRGGILNTTLLFIGAVIAILIAKKINIRRKHYISFIGAFLLLISLFGGILYLRHKDTNFLSKFGTSAYLYFTGTIPAVESFVQTPWNSHLIGYFTFSGVYQILDAGAGLFQQSFLTSNDYQTFYAPITKQGPFNSVGHIAYYYADFGLTGVLVIVYLLGFGATLLFFSIYKKPTIITIQFSGIATAFILFTIRGTMTAGISTWVTIGILTGQYVLFKQLHKKEVL